MNNNLVNIILKNLSINTFTYLIFFIITNNRKSIKENIIKIILASGIMTVIYVLLNDFIDSVFLFIISYLMQILFIRILIRDDKKSIITANLIANAIEYTMFTVASVLEFIPKILLNITMKSNIDFLLIVIINFGLFIVVSKLKKLKNGLSFLQNNSSNDYLDIVLINISSVVILIYCLFGNFYGDVTKQILISFSIVGIIMVIMIQKTLTLYYKQKLLEKNITDYKNDISERDAKIKQLSDEKFRISKLNHEFYNRQKSLELKVKEFVNNANLNTEIASELDVMEQINNLSKEYSSKHEKIKNPSKLPLTEITEIDDMFKYMQNECKENNINFELQINGNIHHMVNNIIEQSKLVTLIGDHIRDAIIAVKSSNNSYRSIIALLGIKDNTYEFCVHDTGIEFGIETLLKLGVEPITTHKDEGGTGIGFITTFETLKETNASLIIEEKHEIADNDYTKAVIIRFDGKHEYKIRSYRAKEINKKIKDREMIVENI